MMIEGENKGASSRGSPRLLSPAQRGNAMILLGFTLVGILLELLSLRCMPTVNSADQILEAPPFTRWGVNGSYRISE